MPVRHSIWNVGQRPSALREGTLPSESLLEEMIVAEPAILSEQWMIIGRQANTGFGGRIDLLAIAPDASLVLIELKRSRTPREVVAQAIVYASWAESLDADEISRIYSAFTGGGNLPRVQFALRILQPTERAEVSDDFAVVANEAEHDGELDDNVVLAIEAGGLDIDNRNAPSIGDGTHMRHRREGIWDAPQHAVIVPRVKLCRKRFGVWRQVVGIDHFRSPVSTKPARRGTRSSHPFSSHLAGFNRQAKMMFFSCGP